jgi:hypothetical protein
MTCYWASGDVVGVTFTSGAKPAGKAFPSFFVLLLLLLFSSREENGERRRRAHQEGTDGTGGRVAGFSGSYSWKRQSENDGCVFFFTFLPASVAGQSSLSYLGCSRPPSPRWVSVTFRRAGGGERTAPRKAGINLTVDSYHAVRWPLIND